MILRKIISGGQTGADRGGLLAAKDLGLETGGWIPRGWRTEKGSEPDLATEFRLCEHFSDKYPPRTKANIHDSDATLIFGDLRSRGTRLALELLGDIRKHFFLVIWPPNSLPVRREYDLRPVTFAEWLERNGIEVLNVAGNRESKNPGIEAACRAFIVKALKP